MQPDVQKIYDQLPLIRCDLIDDQGYIIANKKVKFTALMVDFELMLRPVALPVSFILKHGGVVAAVVVHCCNPSKMLKIDHTKLYKGDSFNIQTLDIRIIE